MGGFADFEADVLMVSAHIVQERSDDCKSTGEDIMRSGYYMAIDTSGRGERWLLSWERAHERSRRCKSHSRTRS